MKERPNTQISLDAPSPEGKLRPGLDPKTATMDDCIESMLFLSEGHVWLQRDRTGYTITAKTVNNKATEEADKIGYFIKVCLADIALIRMSPTEKLATVLNDLATRLDSAAPTPQGVPTRMQGLGLIQKGEGRTL